MVHQPTNEPIPFNIADSDLRPLSLSNPCPSNKVFSIARSTSRLEEELKNNPLLLHSAEHKSVPIIRRAKLVAASTVFALSIELV